MNQLESSVMPYMAEDLYRSLGSSMKTFVRKSVVEEATIAEKITSIDLNKKRIWQNL